MGPHRILTFCSLLLAHPLHATSNFSWDKVTWLKGGGIKNEDVSGWKENTRITQVELSNKGVIVRAQTRHWPVYTDSNGKKLQGNFWVIVPRGGRFLAATWEWRRPNQYHKFHGHSLKKMYEYSFPGHIKVSPLNRWRPKGGDVVGFMISHFARMGAGRVVSGRGLPADRVKMRTNIQWYRLPSVDGKIKGKMLASYSGAGGDSGQCASVHRRANGIKKTLITLSRRFRTSCGHFARCQRMAQDILKGRKDKAASFRATCKNYKQCREALKLIHQNKNTYNQLVRDSRRQCR